MGNFVKNRRIQSGSSGAVLPGGDSAVRPDAPEAGLIRFNSDSLSVEFFDGTQFVTLASGGAYGNANVAAYLPTYTGNIANDIAYAGYFFADVFQGNTANVLTLVAVTSNTADIQITSAISNSIFYANADSYAVTDANLSWDQTTLSVTGNVDADYLNATVIQATDISTGNLDVDFIYSSNFSNVTVQDGLIVQGIIEATGNISTSANAIVGSTQILGSGNIILDGTNINGLAEPIADDDAATKNYVDSSAGNTQALFGNIVIGNTTITTDGTYANVTIEPTASANGLFVIDASTGMLIPSGNTAQRPGNAAAGTIRYNSSTDIVEYYDGNSWAAVGSTYGTITTQVLNGDNSTDEFTLDQNATANSVIVVNNGVVQQPGVAYDVAGNVITFAEPPAVADTITVRFVSPVTTVNEITNDAGTHSISVDESGVGNLAATLSVQLPTYTANQAANLTNTAIGQVIFVTDGDSGSPCLAVFSAGNWRRVALGANIAP